MGEFLIVKNGTAIKCMICSTVSDNPHDVCDHYCRKCERTLEPGLTPQRTVYKKMKLPSLRLGMAPYKRVVLGSDQEGFATYKPTLPDDRVGFELGDPVEHYKKFAAEMQRHDEERDSAFARIERGHRYCMIGLVVLVLVIVLLTVLEIT